MARPKSIWILLLLMSIIGGTSYAISFPPGVQMMMENERQIALGISFLAAFLAGVITFTSPCGFALLPTYFAVAFKDRNRSLIMTCMFSLGLISAFTLFGIIAGLAGNFFNPFKQQFAVLSGIALLVLGILLLLNKSLWFLNFQIGHGNEGRERRSLWGTFLVGFFFSAGWTPCIGAILGGVILLGANAGTLLKSAALLATYGLGAVLPLILLSLIADRTSVSHWIQGKAFSLKIAGYRITTHAYNLFGGFILIAMGTIMIMFQGTTFFQIYLPQYTGWSMTLWGSANQWLAKNPMILSQASHWIGALLAVGLGAVFVTYFIVTYFIKKNGG